MKCIESPLSMAGGGLLVGIRVPERPDSLEGIGRQRSRLILWIPVIVLLLVLVGSNLGYQQLTHEWTTADGSQTTTWTLYEERVHTSIEGDLPRSQNTSASLDAAATEFDASHGDGIDIGELGDARQRSTADLAASYGGILSAAILLSLLLIIVAFERASKGMFACRWPRMLELASALLGVLLLITLGSALLHQVDFGAAAPEALGYPDVDGRLWGSPSTQQLTGGEEKIGWAPGSSIWFVLLAGLSVAVLIPFHIAEVAKPGWWGEHDEDESSWVRDWVSLLPTTLALLAMLLFVMALLLPWATLTQSWAVAAEPGEDGPGEDRLYEFTWDAGLFASSFYNHSVLGTEASDSSSTEDGSIGISHLDEAISDRMRPMILGGLLLAIPLVLTLFPKALRLRLGPGRVWLIASLLLAGWVMATASSGALGELGPAAAVDVVGLTPSDDVVVHWSSNVAPGPYGHGTGRVLESDVPGVSPEVVLNWSPGWGLIAAGLAGSLALVAGLLTLTGVHEAVRSSRAPALLRLAPVVMHGPYRADDWLGGPSATERRVAMGVAMMMLALTLSAGGTLSASLETSGDVGPPALKVYEVDLNDEDGDDAMDGNLQDGESHVLVLELPAQSVDNVTFIHFQAGCSDNVGGFGDNNPIGEDTDSIRIEVDVPEEFGEDILIEDEQCQDFWSWYLDIGDDSSNDGTHDVQARNAHEAGLQYTNDSMMYTWTVTITAITRGSLGGTGQNEDTELYAAVYSYWSGYEGIITEKTDDGGEENT